MHLKDHWRTITIAFVAASAGAAVAQMDDAAPIRIVGLEFLVEDRGPDGQWRVVAHGKPWGTPGAINPSSVNPRIVLVNHDPTPVDLAVNVTYYRDDATHYVL